MKGWMSPKIRVVCWATVALALVAFGCGVFELFQGGDWPLLGAALIGWNIFNLTRLGHRLWEDARG